MAVLCTLIAGLTRRTITIRIGAIISHPNIFSIYGQKTILTWDQYGTDADPDKLRLTKVKDPSGRFISITYVAPDSNLPKHVEGSDGQWVDYTWQEFIVTGASSSYPVWALTRADYSDGTFATYTYDETQFLFRDSTTGDTLTETALSLITARDTRAEGPMQSIYYEYKALGQFRGQMRQEKHLGITGAGDAIVSTVTSTVTIDAESATATETRGDASQTRTFFLEKQNDVPLLKRKSDFKGFDEVFE